LRRNPEIRWRLTEDDISRFALQQKQILKNAASVVKPGGRVVYSTCSVEREENEEVIEGFPARQVFTIRTWPHREGCDGFFMTGFQDFSGFTG